GPVAVSASASGTVHTVGEAAGTSTSLSNYTSSISCTNGTSGTNSGPLNVTVFPGQDTVCTITNTQKNGTIEVIKHLSPTNDPGRFNLQVDGTTQKANAGNLDTTGAVSVTPGTHSAGEVAGTSPATSLSDYTTAWSCSTNGGTASVGTGTSITGISVNSNDAVVCTIDRKSDEERNEVIKHLSPTNDQDRFNLQVDGTTQKANAGNLYTPAAVSIRAGTVSGGQASGLRISTSLSDYTTAWSCSTNGGTASVGTGTSITGISVNSNDAVVCT